MHILIKNTHILCSSSKYHKQKKDILIKDGNIIKIDDHIDVKPKIIIDKPNTYVSLGWVDLFSDFCEPGFEHKETLQSGKLTSAMGGYTDVFLIPNLNPTTSNKSAVEFLKNKNELVNIHPIGAVSKNLEGKELAEMNDMHNSGAIAFSDGRKSIQNAGLFSKALQYVKSFDGVLIEIAEDTSIAPSALMNESPISTEIGLAGKPNLAEDIQTYRNIELMRYAESRMHLTGVSTLKSIELIAQAKKTLKDLTCSVTPYHLLYNDSELIHYNSLFKVNPPLREEKDRQALINAVLDGTIDCIASHHTPQTFDEKVTEFEYAKNGMITLQTMLSMLLKVGAEIPIEQWVTLLSENPRKIFNLPQYTIEENKPACLTIFSTTETWELLPTNNASLSDNSPLLNETLKGKILATINNYLFYINE